MIEYDLDEDDLAPLKNVGYDESGSFYWWIDWMGYHKEYFDDQD